MISCLNPISSLPSTFSEEISQLDVILNVQVSRGVETFKGRTRTLLDKLLCFVRSSLRIMNHRSIEVMSHHEKGPIHYLIRIASQCSQIFLMIHEPKES